MSTKAMEWIKVEDRMPSPMRYYPTRSERVLVCWGRGRMEIAQAEFSEDGSRRKWIVVECRGETSFPIQNTRWMPLPEPPNP